MFSSSKMKLGSLDFILETKRGTFKWTLKLENVSFIKKNVSFIKIKEKYSKYPFQPLHSRLCQNKKSAIYQAYYILYGIISCETSLFMLQLVVITKIDTMQLATGSYVLLCTCCDLQITVYGDQCTKINMESNITKSTYRLGTVILCVCIASHWKNTGP